jgi:hypothetical protein
MRCWKLSALLNRLGIILFHSSSLTVFFWGEGGGVAKLTINYITSVLGFTQQESAFPEQSVIWINKVKGKVHSRTGHEGLEGK